MLARKHQSRNVHHCLTLEHHRQRERGQQFACRSGVQNLQACRQDVREAAQQALTNCLTETRLPLGEPTVGKVRDTYSAGNKLVIVTTDRQSAFDRLLASVPFKGQVLNQTAVWWFQQTQHIARNALLAAPDPNVAVMKRCDVFPVEFVVRGFVTGSTETSLWTHYAAGSRSYCGNALPDGLRKNDRLAQTIITPTTKAADRDLPISPHEIVEQGLMTSQDWEAASAAALALFEFGQAEAYKRGLLLVDTKYEFGRDADGNVLLIDEIHTPDSSRYWLADSYEQRHTAGQEPESIDKEFLRLWFRENCDPYKDALLPEAPSDLVCELSARYVYLYETITGCTFELPDPSVPLHERLDLNMAAVQLQ